MIFDSKRGLLRNPGNHKVFTNIQDLGETAHVAKLEDSRPFNLMRRLGMTFKRL